MRIAIVNDILMAVELLKRIILSVPNYEIAWVAYNGKEAIEKCTNDVPDLILMDLLMPVMDGPQAVYHIMKQAPCAILIVTASLTTNIDKIFEAMGYGALDVVKTPVLSSNASTIEAADLLTKIEMISSLIGISKPGVRTTPMPSKRQIPPLIAIGASTGGPKALALILSHLPADFTATVVIIQHVDEQFAPGLVHWLSSQTCLPVYLAAHGAPLKRGAIYVAGTNNHLVMTKEFTLEYTSNPEEEFYRPSVDVFFKSLADNWPDKGVAMLLTGMGKDGAKGLKLLKDKGWYTIAEHASSCVVYGMPKAAIELGAAKEILPLKEIGPKLLNLNESKR